MVMTAINLIVAHQLQAQNVLNPCFRLTRDGGHLLLLKKARGGQQSLRYGAPAAMASNSRFPTGASMVGVASTRG
jgi:hypothetical protein